MTLHLLTFNNYYNRQVKVYHTIDEYPGALAVLEYINFNPNDGVTTEQVINYEGEMPDYLLVSQDGEIVSRWFVIESVRTRSQQFKMTLYRDLVADHLEQLLDAPMFVEKATLKPNSPFLFNKEDFTVNQIKASEKLLTDHPGCAWIVGYYAKNTDSQYLHGVVPSDYELPYDAAISTSFEAWEYNATENPIYGSLDQVNYRIYFEDLVWGLQSQPGYFEYNKSGDFVAVMYVEDSDTSIDIDASSVIAARDAIDPLIKDNAANLLASAMTYVPNYISESKLNTFSSYNGQTIKDINGKYFTISIYADAVVTEDIDIPAGLLFNHLSAICTNSGVVSGTPNNQSFKIQIKRTQYKMHAKELTDKEVSWDIRGDKLLTEDAPYNIFAIPYGKVQLEQDGYAQAISSAEVSLATAESIIRTMGKNLYDIQLLPYCPINNSRTDGILPMYNYLGYSIIKAPGEDTLDNHIGFILHVPKARFDKTITHKIVVGSTAEDIKVSNECRMYRLCSPNYNGSFEFSVAKNNGVSYFNVDCEYKPFQPYIHVYPDFKGLYSKDGKDFDRNRQEH